MFKISIIMPVHNSAEYLQKSLESITKQSYADWELLLIDDGSTDGSSILCSEFAKLDTRIQAVHIAHSGPSAARNRGIELSSGDYCMFIDSDDYLEKDALSLLSQSLKRSAAELTIFPYYSDKVIGDHSRIELPALYEELRLKTNQEFKEQYSFFLKRGLVKPVWNKLYKKDLIDQYEARFPSEMNVSEDYVFNIQLYRHVRDVTIIEQPLYHYVSRKNGSLTSSFNENRFNECKQLYLYCLEHLSTWNPALLDPIQSDFITNINVCINNLFNKDCLWTFSEKYRHIDLITNDQHVKECVELAENRNFRNKTTAFLVKNKQILLLMAMGKVTRTAFKRK